MRAAAAPGGSPRPMLRGDATLRTYLLVRHAIIPSLSCCNCLECPDPPGCMCRCRTTPLQARQAHVPVAVERHC